MKKLLVALGLFALGACAAGSIVPQFTPKFVMGDYCRIARPIVFDAKVDSEATIKQIIKHNSQWVCMCENDCPDSK